jgi:hypothetical protein
MTSRCATRFTPLSQLIRQGFEEEMRKGVVLPGQGDEPILSDLSVRELVTVTHDRRSALSLQDEVLAASIRCYRRSPSSAWAAVLLEMLSPMLVAAGNRFSFLPDGVSEEDVHHQLIAEVLHAARFLALPKRTEHIQLWVKRRVLTRIARWLMGNIRSQCESLERVVEEGGAYRDADRLFLMELSDSGVSPENLGLLYCSRVLGITVRELAVEMGVSMEAVRSRQRRALKRLRGPSRAETRRFSDELRTAA